MSSKKPFAFHAFLKNEMTKIEGKTKKKHATDTKAEMDVAEDVPEEEEDHVEHEERDDDDDDDDIDDDDDSPDRASKKKRAKRRKNAGDNADPDSVFQMYEEEYAEEMDDQKGEQMKNFLSSNTGGRSMAMKDTDNDDDDDDFTTGRVLQENDDAYAQKLADELDAFDEEARGASPDDGEGDSGAGQQKKRKRDEWVSSKSKRFAAIKHQNFLRDTKFIDEFRTFVYFCACICVCGRSYLERMRQRNAHSATVHRLDQKRYVDQWNNFHSRLQILYVNYYQCVKDDVFKDGSESEMNVGVVNRKVAGKSLARIFLTVKQSDEIDFDDDQTRETVKCYVSGQENVTKSDHDNEDDDDEENELRLVDLILKVRDETYSVYDEKKDRYTKITHTGKRTPFRVQYRFVPLCYHLFSVIKLEELLLTSIRERYGGKVKRRPRLSPSQWEAEDDSVDIQAARDVADDEEFIAQEFGKLQDSIDALDTLLCTHTKTSTEIKALNLESDV